MDRLDAIGSTRLRAAIISLIETCVHIEQVILGGDTYTRVEGVSAGKPESKAPGNVTAASCERFIEERAEALARYAKKMASRLDNRMDVARDAHDGIRTNKEARIVHHLTSKYTKQKEA